MAALESVFNFVPNLAQSLGISEASLRILFTPLIGYPLAYIQRTYLHNKSETTKHIYVLICGLSLAFFNYGFDIKHSAITVLLNYLLLQLIGGTQISVAFSFGLNMGYLLTAYYKYASVKYDQTWTTPQCILTLRMIGLAFDLFDGQKSVTKLSKEQKTLCIAKTPSLLELYAYIYFYGGYFVGPQFSVRRYLDLIHGRLSDNTENRPPQCVQESLVSFRWGIFYAFVVALIVPFYPNSFLFTIDFTEASFVYKLYIMAVWGHVTFSQYCCIFSLFDAVCIMSGLTYNGQDINGKSLWDACIGAKAWNYEVSLTIREVIASMNISTSMWSARYIYKRLKFLGNRYISQMCTLLFLALWHGWYVGYYITFAFQMAVVNFENQFAVIAKKTQWITKLDNNRHLKIPLYIIRKIWQLEYLAYPLVCFTFLQWPRIKVVHGALYYYPYIVFFGWPVVYYLVLLPMLNRRDKVSKDTTKADMGQESNGANKDNHSKME